MMVMWDSASWNPGGIVALAGLVLFLSLPLLINLTRGPTCTVLVRTAVQTQKIPGLTRQKKAAKLMAWLTPAIAAAQGASPAPATAPATSDIPGPLTG
jgi:hypothetical protein